MIYSIISMNDIFYTESECSAAMRSSNPYDYIRDGYYLDNAMRGGKKYVHFNSNISSYRTSNIMGVAYERKRS